MSKKNRLYVNIPNDSEKDENINKTAIVVRPNNEVNEIKNINIEDNIFSYQGKQFNILSNDGDIWVRGKEVAEVLKYKDTDQAIRNNVEDEDKKTFEELKKLGPVFETGHLKTDNKTIFINESGVYDLLFNSKKKEAKLFKRWIRKEVLPCLRKNGSYSMQRDEKYTSPYKDNAKLVKFDKKNVIYIGYLGLVRNEHLFKFGESSDIFTRLVQHEDFFKTYNGFELMSVKETDNYKYVENKFKAYLKFCHLNRKWVINGKAQTELFTLTVAHSLKQIKIILKQIIKQCPLPSIAKYENELKLLHIQNENDFLRNEVKQLQFQIKFIHGVKQDMRERYQFVNEQLEYTKGLLSKTIEKLVEPRIENGHKNLDLNPKIINSHNPNHLNPPEIKNEEDEKEREKNRLEAEKERKKHMQEIKKLKYRGEQQVKKSKLNDKLIDLYLFWRSKKRLPDADDGDIYHLYLEIKKMYHDGQLDDTDIDTIKDVLNVDEQHHMIPEKDIPISNIIEVLV